MVPPPLVSILPTGRGAAPQSDPSGGGLGQVTVGVLFTIHSLQIFFLDQNVNAFLGAIFRRGRGSERERKTRSGSEHGRTPLHPLGTD